MCTVARPSQDSFLLLESPLSLGRLGRQVLLSACCGPARCPGLPSALGDIQLVSVKRRSQCLAAAGTETGWSYMAVESLFKRVFFFYSTVIQQYTVQFINNYTLVSNLYLKINIIDSDF